MIKPPFNYTGNKNRLIDYFSNTFFPKDESLKFLDLFGGGGTVSINTSYNDTTYNDINLWVPDLIKAFKRISSTEVLDYFKYLVDKYKFSSSHFFGNSIYKRNGNSGLKDFNEKPYLKFRKDLNVKIVSEGFGKTTLLEILFLSFYSFNNDIRFNSKGLINIPIGKTDLNTNSIEKVITFMDAVKRKKIKVTKKDFSKIDFSKYDFIYMDPPYFGTDAVYNANWSKEVEDNLKGKIVNYSKKGGIFVLSNMSWRKGKKNDQLLSWAAKNGFFIHEIDYSYKASSYNRERSLRDQEVIITNAKNL